MLQATKSKKSTKFTTTLLKNKEMNDNTYALRRKVIELIYEAKELVPTLPRVDVRICHTDKTGSCILGVGRMKQNVIWIAEESISSDWVNLRHVVFHELLHAVYGIKHDEKCPLMKAQHHLGLNKAECHKHFMKWVKKSTKGKV